MNAFLVMSVLLSFAVKVVDIDSELRMTLERVLWLEFLLNFIMRKGSEIMQNNSCLGK